MDSSSGPLVIVVDMPVYIGSDEVKIEESVKSWYEMGRMMEIPEVAFKASAIVFEPGFSDT